MRAKVLRLLAATTAAFLLLVSSASYGEALEEKPTALAMAGDALFARPALLVITLAGGAIYVVSLPFSLLGGNAAEAGQTLFLEPARTTFVRCLGCTMNGRKNETVYQPEDNAGTNTDNN